MPQDYHGLEIWNRSMDYTVKVYKFTASLPADEKYTLLHNSGDPRHRCR